MSVSIEQRLVTLEAEMNHVENRLSDLEAGIKDQVIDCSHDGTVCAYDHDESDYMKCSFCKDSFSRLCNPCLAKAHDRIEELERELAFTKALDKPCKRRNNNNDHH